MREIKFRAWDTKLKDWLKPQDLMLIKLDGTKCFYGYTKNLIPAPEGQQILMQFTGLHDKNGKEIYEGDIVKCFDILGGEVYDHEVRIPHFFQEIWCETEWDDVTKERTTRTKVEVIGNIYENPELLTS